MKEVRARLSQPFESLEYLEIQISSIYSNRTIEEYSDNMRARAVPFLEEMEQRGGR